MRKLLLLTLIAFSTIVCQRIPDPVLLDVDGTKKEAFSIGKKLNFLLPVDVTLKDSLEDGNMFYYDKAVKVLKRIIGAPNGIIMFDSLGKKPIVDSNSIILLVDKAFKESLKKGSLMLVDSTTKKLIPFLPVAKKFFRFNDSGDGLTYDSVKTIDSAKYALKADTSKYAANSGHSATSGYAVTCSTATETPYALYAGYVGSSTYRAAVNDIAHDIFLDGSALRLKDVNGNTIPGSGVTLSYLVASNLDTASVAYADQAGEATDASYANWAAYLYKGTTPYSVDALGSSISLANDSLLLKNVSGIKISGASLSGYQATLSAASATVSGYLTSTDWSTFNGKQDAGDFISLTSLSATSPLSYVSTTGVFSMPQAGTSASGYLSGTDWNLFNSKVTITIVDSAINVSANALRGTDSVLSASISFNALGLSTEVTNRYNQDSVLNSSITQTANSIQLKTTQNDSVRAALTVSNINGGTVKIAAKNIQIDGNTTFSNGYDPSGKINSGEAAADINNNTTTINGGKLTTGTVLADSIRGNLINGVSIYGGTYRTNYTGNVSGSLISNTQIKSYYDGEAQAGKVDINSGADAASIIIGTGKGGTYKETSIGSDAIIINGTNVLTAIGGKANTSAVPIHTNSTESPSGGKDGDTWFDSNNVILYMKAGGAWIRIN